jgi:DNA-binding NtrC family response regulator
MLSLLLIEDDTIMGEALMQRFEIEGYRTVWCRRLAEAAGRIDEPWSAVICDVRLPDGIATHWFIGLSDDLRAVPWFFLTGYGSVNDAVAAIRAGAREYLAKPFDIEKMVQLVRQSHHAAESQEDAGVLGVSPVMRRIEEKLHKVAGQKVSVLLAGESGVGKEVAAQMIHGLDPRSQKGSFIAVNCAAVPETMAESEFFGYEKGAFSGAQRSHKGYLERADKGTLFLDEVGELSASMQAKLLRALQERCFFKLGSEKTTSSDFRVIAATNRNLYEDMAAGIFREDLFYRLAVIQITLPPLRERPEDIRWLAERILRAIAEEQKRPLAISEAFMRSLLSRRWQGNVRELHAFLEESVIFSEAGMLDTTAYALEVTNRAPESGPFIRLSAMVADAERSHIKRALTLSDGSMSKSADLLGISRKTLWEKMKRLTVAAGP